MDKIFIQIASYRDPELIPTIKDCIDKAKYPERLTFGICWQNCPEENSRVASFLYSIPNAKILDIPHLESKGMCWARSEIQKLYNGEEYTLQLDSHHRFARNWDEELIEMMKLTGSEKPIITAYVGSYDPLSGQTSGNAPLKMVATKFTKDGTILFIPLYIDNSEKLKRPIRARFVSGHFFFTLGKHCLEYKYDPYLYFAGDEISLSIRSFTLGYDLYHPHKMLIWHEYTRNNRVKHWDDFIEEKKNEGKIKSTWWEMDRISKMRLQQLLKEEDHGIDLCEYGLGDIRTHKEYEIYSGIDFKTRSLHKLTLGGVDPPINDYNEWMSDSKKYYYQRTV